MRRIPLITKLVAFVFLCPAFAWAVEVEPKAAAPKAAVPKTESPKNVELADRPADDLVVYLRPASGSGTGHKGLLAREIARQAFLLAAREQLGLTTRDFALREPGRKRAEAADRLLDVRISPLPSGETTIEVRRISGDKRETLFKKTANLPGGERLDYHGLVEWCEQLSREELPEALKKAGYNLAPGYTAERSFSRDAVVADEAVEFIKEIEQKLGRMTCLSQFAAVRSLHDKIRRDGESQALIGALVRGYANLGMLTELHWHTGHEVFKARALLYAHRLHVASERIGWARSHRAYACAACGLHSLALSDLKKAAAAIEQADESETKQIDLPEWIELIAHFCRFKSDRLAARADHQFRHRRPRPGRNYAPDRSVQDCRALRRFSCPPPGRVPRPGQEQRRRADLNDPLQHAGRSR